MKMEESIQIFSLELKRTNEIIINKRHGLITKAQKPKIRCPQRNEPACTLVPASTFKFVTYISGTTVVQW